MQQEHAFWHNSPEARIAQVLQTMTGMCTLQGKRGGPPEILYGSVVDYCAAALVAAGVSSALFERERSGTGQYVGVSLLRSALTMQSARMIWAEGDPKDVGRDMRSGGITGIHPTREGYLYISANTPHFWQSLCEKTSLEALSQDERYDTVRKRAQHCDEIVPQLHAAARRYVAPCVLPRSTPCRFGPRVGEEIDALVVPCSCLPAAVEDDPYPFECQRPDSGLAGAASGASFVRHLNGARIDARRTGAERSDAHQPREQRYCLRLGAACEIFDLPLTSSDCAARPSAPARSRLRASIRQALSCRDAYGRSQRADKARSEQTGLIPMSDKFFDPSPEARPVLDYPCGEAPVAGMTSEIVPGVLWLRMPMPLALDHINLWAIRDGNGWAAVDAGLQTSDTAAAWRKLFADGGALAQGGLTRLFATHMHPDHIGMAGWLTRKFDCRLWMTRTEYLMCRVLAADTGRAAPDDGVRFYRNAGWDDDAIELYRTRFGGFGKFVHALPDSYRRLNDGELLDIGEHRWRVVTGKGHSPEHACFYCAELKLLISGDQVLPRISSNVSVFPTEPDANPMADWLASLDKLRQTIPDDVLVLPAHNEPFRGLHARLDYLTRSQHAALDRLRQALMEPKRAVDVFAQLFSRPIGSEPGLLGMATGESVAHLNYLLHNDEAEMELRSDGCAWYRLK